MGTTRLNPNIGIPSTQPDGPRRLHPDHMRTIEIESQHGGITRMDGYVMETDRPIVRRKGNDVQVRAVLWAKARNATVDVRWTETGLSFWEINQIRIYSWPEGALVQVHENVE